MSCAFWNGAAAAPSATFPPYLPGLDDGVSEKQRRYSPSCDEKRGNRERRLPRYSGQIGRDGFPQEHRAPNTPGHLSKANCSDQLITVKRNVSICVGFISLVIYLFHLPPHQLPSAKCPAWRTAAGAARVHQRSSPSIRRGPTLWHPKPTR